MSEPSPSTSPAPRRPGRPTLAERSIASGAGTIGREAAAAAAAGRSIAHDAPAARQWRPGLPVPDRPGPPAPAAPVRAGPPPSASAALIGPGRHCLIETDEGMVPGLLVAWEKRRGHGGGEGWWGRVVHVAAGQAGPVVVEETLPAHRLRPPGP